MKPRVLRYKSGYFDYHFLVNSDRDLDEIVFHILHSLNKEDSLGWAFNMQPPKAPDLPRDVVEALPPSNTRDKLTEAWKFYDREMEDSLSEAREYNRLIQKLAIGNPSGFYKEFGCILDDRIRSLDLDDPKLL